VRVPAGPAGGRRLSGDEEDERRISELRTSRHGVALHRHRGVLSRTNGARQWAVSVGVPQPSKERLKVIPVFREVQEQPSRQALGARVQQRGGGRVRPHDDAADIHFQARKRHHFEQILPLGELLLGMRP
jgi:hypothetical protein